MRRLLVLSFTLWAMAACAHAAESRPVTFRTSSGDTARLDVRVADTTAERQKGLSGVSRLAKDSGMAFLYPNPSTDRFWMKDTRIPLSVAFIAEGRVIAIEDMVPCTTDPCRTYGAPAPFTAAVEAPAGWYRTRHIEVGSTATFGPPS